MRRHARAWPRRRTGACPSRPSAAIAALAGVALAVAFAQLTGDDGPITTPATQTAPAGTGTQTIPPGVTGQPNVTQTAVPPLPDATTAPVAPTTPVPTTPTTPTTPTVPTTPGATPGTVPGTTVPLPPPSTTAP